MFLRAYPTAGFPDQTAINAACAGRTFYLRERWNFLLGASHSAGDWIEPRIIHCTGVAKPWFHRDAFLGELYRCHRRQTPFPLTEPRAVYRSKARLMLILLTGRRKYWYRFLMGGAPAPLSRPISPPAASGLINLLFRRNVCRICSPESLEAEEAGRDLDYDLFTDRRGDLRVCVWEDAARSLRRSTAPDKS